MKKLLLCLLLCLPALLVSGGTALAEKTTVMMYMVGTDIEKDCVADMKEIAKASYGSDVDVVVLAGGTKSWSDRRLRNGTVNLFTISGGSWSPAADWGMANMGSQSTLAGYITYCLRYHSADRYVLILWDHGGGSAGGICYDQLYDDDPLSLSEIEAALAEVKRYDPGFHLAVFGADACLMGSYELAEAVEDHADYMVASQELEPWLGWYYTNWLNDLGKRPDMSSRDLAVSIVRSYRYACEKQDPNDHLTLSVTDLSAIDELTRYMEKLSESLTASLRESYPAMSRTFRSLYTFGNYDEAGSDMVDMKAFLKACAAYDPENASGAIKALERAVIYNYASRWVPDAAGLSIFVPMENAGSMPGLASSYTTSGTSGYSSFITAFADTASGGDYVFADSSSAPEGMTQEDLTAESFLDSAYSYSFGSGLLEWLWNAAEWSFEDNDWGSLLWGFGGNYGTGYGYGSGFGYNGNGFVIAGDTSSPSSASAPAFEIAGIGAAAGVTQNGIAVVIAGDPQAQPTQQPLDTLVIAGKTPAPTKAPESLPAQSTGSFIIAGKTPAPSESIPVTVEANTDDITLPAAISSSNGYSLRLSAEDTECLAYVELVLMMDLSAQGETALLDLGAVRDTWVDWSGNTVYALFDGTWPTINGIPVMLTDQSRTESFRRSLIPCRVNGEDTYLVVLFSGSGKEGTIAGTSGGWTGSGSVSRSLTPLNTGDVIKPRYILWYSKDADGEKASRNFPDDGDSGAFAERSFVFDGTQKVTYESLADTCGTAGLRLCFRLHDVFGEVTLTDHIPLETD
ncbi:MAG: hypothetical protein J5859_03385 [Clostridia bacterium]|nr:hypothetical protein [Clostridia bacterium]